MKQILLQSVRRLIIKTLGVGFCLVLHFYKLQRYNLDMQRFLLAGILFLAFFLRVSLLEWFPVGFTADEASFGYDAYSILKTGRDQWGRGLPLFLESFGDFKTPLYSYLTVLSVSIFGLTKLATRLPNALLGTAAVYVTYLLVRELRILSEKDLKINNHFHLKKLKLEIVASLLLSISPWHIQLSRGAFESNLTTFFLPLGILIFLKGVKSPKFLVWASFIFGINLFSYHSARMVTPLIFLFLTFIFRKELLKIPRKFLFYGLSVFLVFVCLTLYTFSQGAGRRAADVSIFRGALEAQADARLKAIESGLNPAFARIVHNKYRVVTTRFVNSYKQYFSLKFLFKDGVGEATYGMAPGIGVLYWFELVLLLGFVILIFKRREDRTIQILLFWILVGPIPAGLTTGVGYAGNRAAVMMPGIQIAVAFGIIPFCQYLKKYFSPKVRLFFGIGLISVALSFVLSFTKEYFIDSQTQLSKGVLYGNLEAAYWLAENANDKARVIVSRKLSEPHIFVAFAKKWNPEQYQKETSDWRRYQYEHLIFLDQLNRYYLGKFVFKSMENEDFLSAKNTLLVGRPEEFPDEMKVIKTFYYPDGEVSVVITEPFGDLYADSRN